MHSGMRTTASGLSRHFLLLLAEQSLAHKSNQIKVGPAFARTRIAYTVAENPNPLPEGEGKGQSLRAGL